MADNDINLNGRKKDFFDRVRPYSIKYVKPLVNFIERHKFLSALIFFTTLIFLFVLNQFSVLMKNTLILSSLILIGGVSNIYQRYIRVHLGIEFIMLSAIIAGYIYGAFIGGVVAFLTFALAMYFEGRFPHTLFASFILITLVGMAAHLFSNKSITFAGITLTILYDLILVPVYIAFFRARIPSIMLFAITHIIWNYWVFTTIAPSLLSILT